MPTVNVAYGTDSSHDISLSDGSTTYGLIFARGGVRVLQEVPLSPPASPFANEQQNWIGGRGRVRYVDDPTGFFDSTTLWSTTEGKLFPSLQWKFSDGIRSHTTLLPDDNQNIAWWKLYGSTPASQLTRYLSVTFTPSGNYTAANYYIILRRRGTPGTLTLELCSDDSGSPGSVLQTRTKTVSDVTDTLALYLPFTVTQALTGSTAYHLKVYGASTDSADNHWEVLVNDDGTSSKYSTDNSTWTAAGVTMYYRVTDADTKRQWFFFELYGGTYAVSGGLGVTPRLFLNGIRGTATAGTSNTLTCSTLTMTTDQYAGARIKIIDGVGDGQSRQIASNTATAFTVTDNWVVTPTATSVFVVYDTDYWIEIGTTGLTNVTAKPIAADGVCYFPQGAVTIRRMRVNGTSHDFANDGSNAATVMCVNAEGVAPVVYGCDSRLSTIYASATKAWGTDLAFGTAKKIGSSDTRINNLFGHNRVLHIFKEDGVYTYSNNVVEKYNGNFDDVPDLTTGLGVGSKDGQLWFGWGHSVERMQGASVQDMMNFKLGYDGMPETKRGYVSSVVSAVGWLFVAICGDPKNYSTILGWNGYGWHEIFRSNEKDASIQNLHWQANLSARSRLWFDVDGDIACIEFPLYSANPLRETEINYNYEGTVVTATYDNRDPQLYKILSMIRTYIQQGTVEIDYQTNANVGTNTWTVLGSASTSPVTDIDIDLGGIFQVRFRFRLQVANTRTPCILTGWQISGRMIPLKKYQWIGSFRAETEADTYTDELDHNPSTVYSQIQTWAQNQTKLTLRAMNESMDNKTVTVTYPSKTVDWIDGTTWGGRIQFGILET